MIAQELMRCGHYVMGFSYPQWYSKDARSPVMNFIRSRSDLMLFKSLDELRGLTIDFIIATEYGSIISREIFQLPRYGSYNIHNALLPRYRGRHPLTWALINGEETVGVTIHEIVAEVDAGDIVFQEQIPVSMDDTVASLGKRLNEIVRTNIGDLLTSLAAGAIRPVKQDLSRGSFFGKRTPEMGIIDWSKTSLEIYNFIRALTTPYPGARSYYGERLLVFWKAEISPYTDLNQTPGQIVSTDDSASVVATADGAVRIIDPPIVGIRAGDILTSEPVAW